MSNTNYGYATQPGIHGGLYDLSPKEIETKVLELSEGQVAEYGMGVCQKANSTATILPTGTADKFAGILVNKVNVEQDKDGNVLLKGNTSVAIMRKGKIWVRAKAAVAIAYNDDVYLITAGDNVGQLTNNETAETSKLKLNATFIAAKETGSTLALVRLA